MKTPNIVISAKTHHVPQQSDARHGRFVFAYTITIENQDETPVQLMSRHWVIQDGNLKIEEVVGDGVVGEQPLILPGENYSYTSGAVLETDMGTMEGKYYFRFVVKPSERLVDSMNDTVISIGKKQQEEFAIPIPKFLLTVPRTVH